MLNMHNQGTSAEQRAHLPGKESFASYLPSLGT